MSTPCQAQYILLYLNRAGVPAANFGQSRQRGGAWRVISCSQRTQSGIVLGETAVDGKFNEILMMAALLELLDIKGAVALANKMAWRQYGPVQ